MEPTTFPLYSEAWLAYSLTGVVFLGLIYWHMRNAKWLVRTLVVTLLAAGAYTPALVPGHDTWAPAAISMVLSIEDLGLQGFVTGVVSILLVWGLLISLVLAIRYAWKHFIKPKQTANSNNKATNQAAEKS